MKYIIGVDIGTSGTKAIAFNVDGSVVYSAYIAYESISPQSGENEIDANILLNATIKTIGRVIKNTKAESDCLGISFSCAMHSLVAITKTGSPLTNIITWADLRSKDYAEKIRDTPLGQKIYEHTGTPIHPMSPLCKLMWMRDNQPDIFSKAFKFISIKEYIWFHFFGKFQIDYSIASGTGLFDIRSFKWYKESLDAAGIREDHLSEPVSTLHIETALIKKYKSKMNLPASIPFIIGGSDGVLANLGSGVISPGELALTIGTSGAVRMTSAQPKHDPQKRIFNYILTPRLYVSGGPVNNGGNTIKWYVDNFMNKSTSRKKDFSANVQQAADIPAGAAGLIFLPYIFGERAPVWDANAKGVFYGIGSIHTSRHFLRAVIEGISLSLYQIGLSLEETIGPAEKVYASGGFIQSAFWLQMIADIFNKEVLVMNVADASAIGAAMLGLLSLGNINDLQETKKMIKVQHTYAPNGVTHAAYMKNFSAFKQIYGRLKGITK
ncbi:MAG: gluconokinase [Bacteroidetes bacterium]|nr:gluconokinase [Bacteroidota bacterium]